VGLLFLVVASIPVMARFVFPLYSGRRRMDAVHRGGMAVQPVLLELLCGRNPVIREKCKEIIDKGAADADLVSVN
jgi:hypothetical protein